MPFFIKIKLRGLEVFARMRHPFSSPIFSLSFFLLSRKGGGSSKHYLYINNNNKNKILNILVVKVLIYVFYISYKLFILIYIYILYRSRGFGRYQLQMLVHTIITDHLLPVTRPYSKGQNSYRRGNPELKKSQFFS